MSKMTLSHLAPEEMLELDHAGELFLDLNESVKMADDSDLPERVEYLRDSLLHGLGLLTARYWSDDWSDEEKEKGVNILRWANHYRNELRILINEHKGHDCTEARASFRMVTDEVFGAPEGVIH
jgi:hypothetical protein